MRAAVLHGREDVRVEEVDVPRLEPGDVLLRTRVALTCGTDLKVYRRGYHARMIVPPALFGHEVAGEVDDVGDGVTAFRRADHVVAANSAPCGRCEFCASRRESLCDDLLFWNGAYAEFVRIPARVVERNLLRIPDGVPDHKAAAIEPLACVIRGAAAIRPRDAVAVLGTGGIGLMFVALAKSRGASVVVAVGRKPEKLARARALGADATVVADDRLVASLMQASPGGRGFHVAIEAAGQPAVSQAALDVVRKGGTVNLFAGCPTGTELRLDAPRIHYEEITVTATFHHTPADVRAALELIATGGFDPDLVISGQAPLAKLPDVLAGMARGGDALKTAIVP
jgi:L-iditol 2-dehydrogenase